MTVEVVRIYEAGAAMGAGGKGRTAVLVDRLWPRGVRKAGAPFDVWLKDVAPSTALRVWYGHKPERYEEFAARYRRELADPPASGALEGLRRDAAVGDLVLVTATKDLDRSAAVVLRRVLLEP